MLCHISYDRRVFEQAAHVSGGEDDIEMIAPIILLDRLEFAIERRGLRLHHLDLLQTSPLMVFAPLTNWLSGVAATRDLA